MKKRIVSLIMILIMFVTTTVTSNATLSTSKNDTHFINNIIADDEEKLKPRFTDNEVVIKLADCEETRSLQLQQYYSENNNTRSSLTSVSAISESLDLNIDISSMKMLNPSVQKTRSSSYQVAEDSNNMFVIELGDNCSVQEALTELNSNPAIEIAEPNYIYEFCDVPNDTYYEELYAPDKMNLPEVWTEVTGSEEVVVGIIDSGINGTHEDLIDNLWVNPYYSAVAGCAICGRSDDIHGYNFSGNGTLDGKPCGGTPTDTIGHGTHVAGIIGAQGNNAKGVTGVNWNVSLACLGIYNSNYGLLLSDVVEAINYADTHNIKITNNSYEVDHYSSILKDAISNYDGLFIVAAGNSNNNNDINPTYPASYDCPNILTVAASDIYNNLSYFGITIDNTIQASNYGVNSVDVVAPGSDIYSTTMDGSYNIDSGTSMAAPQVAGVAALIKSIHPEYSPLQIKAAICGTIQPTGKTYNVLYDGGIVDALGAIGITSGSMRSVTFDYNYTNAPADFIDYAVIGNKIVQPTIPSRDDYIFDGWYTSPTSGTLFVFDTPINYNTSLYARWSPVITGSYGEKFPDANFREYVLSLINANDSGTRTASTVISSADIDIMANITNINISSKNICDLTGLEYFTGLKEFDCSFNKITNIDLSSLMLLEILCCNSNSLTELDTTGLIRLRELNCHDNVIGTLNLSRNTMIEMLDCAENMLTYINVNGLNRLKEFKCAGNKLLYLNISTLTSLEKLECYCNNLTTLDIPDLDNMTYLDCSFNNLTHLIIRSSLVEIYCQYNNLIVFRADDLSKLDSLCANHNNLSVLDTRNINFYPFLALQYNNINDITDLYNDDIYNWEDFPELYMDPQNLWDANPFIDVLETSNYYKAIEYVYKNDYMTGNGTTRFNPDSTITRADFAKTLYNMAGCPNVEGLTNPFTDVSSSSYYYEAVLWAYNNGVDSLMSGISSTAFSPSSTVTREMVAKVLNSYADRFNIELAQVYDYSAFEDDSQIHSWARSGIAALYEAGVMLPDNENNYNPRAAITRGDVAIILRKFDVVRLYL